MENNDVQEIDAMIEQLQKRKEAIQKKEPEIPDTEQICRSLKREVEDLQIEKMPSFEDGIFSKESLYKKSKDTLQSMILQADASLNTVQNILDRNHLIRNQAKDTISSTAKTFISQKKSEINNYCGDGRSKLKTVDATKKKELMTTYETKVKKAQKVNFLCRPWYDVKLPVYFSFLTTL